MKLKKLLKIINQPQRLTILHATRDNTEYVCFRGYNYGNDFFGIRTAYGDVRVDHIAVTADACLKIYLKSSN